MTQKTTEIETWIESYAEELLRRAIYKVSNQEDAQDLVQETFLSATKSFDKFERKSSPKTWLFTILNNKIIDYYRKNSRSPKKTDIDTLAQFFDADGGWQNDKKPKNWEISSDETHLLDNLEFIEVLNFCIENLPEKYNLAIKMKYYSEKKTEEICQELEISTSNIWQIMHRAKLKLRACIEKNWFVSQ